MNKLSLADFLYNLGFDMRTYAEMDEYIEADGKDRPVPEHTWLREWAEETAAKFGEVKPGLYKRI